jgi:hypothetical protein
MSAHHICGGKLHFARNLAISLAMGCLTNGAVMASDEGDDDRDSPKGGFCTATATSALRACRHGAQDNYWIAIGNCNNLADANARTTCTEQANAGQREGKDQCAVQRAVRLQICQALGEAPYDPRIDPAMFVNPAEIGRSIAPNRYFPLVPGRTWIYKGGTETITVTVARETTTILGVTAAVVHDVVSDNGEVIEDTMDSFAQDIHGNVWYFGEISQEFENGELVSINGSWKAGRNSDKPGIIMKAAPAVGELYRQEFSLGNAEDVAQVLSLTGTARVPGGSCRGNCLVTKEFTPLTPAAIEHKYYAPGVGFVLEVDAETGERLELVEIRNQPD